VSSKRVKPTPGAITGKEGWTAIGVTVETKERLVMFKQAFERMLKSESTTWDYFLKALLDLGPLTWKFLIDETVKGIEASKQACPLPSRASAPSPSASEGKSAHPRS
jgi:hypothetical protein